MLMDVVQALDRPVADGVFPLIQLHKKGQKYWTAERTDFGKVAETQGSGRQSRDSHRHVMQQILRTDFRVSQRHRTRARGIPEDNGQQQ